MQREEILKKKIEVEYVLKKHYGWKAIEEYNCDESCSLCLQNMKDSYVLKLPCSHVYDVDCILEAIIEYYYLKCPDCSETFKRKE